MIKRLLNSQTKNITSAALILGAANLVSAFLGLFRDRLLAQTFGAGDVLDIYYAAFKIPDFIAMLLIMGAISAAIIPVFSQYLARSKEEAWEFTSALLNLFLIFLICVSVVLVIFTPYLISLIAPGFHGEKKELTIFLTRIMFLSPVLLGISNIISGILQVFRRFLVTALAPIMYNLGIILGILFFLPKFGISGLAWGVVLGGVLHLAIQLPVFFSSGFRHRKILTLAHGGVAKVIKLTIPRSLGLAASQINVIVMTAIASTLVSGSIAIFNLANNLIYIPVGLIAVPFSTAAFPILSLKFFENSKKEFLEKFSSTFSQILFLMIPFSFLFFILRAQIVRIVLGVGHFGWLDTRLTAACLGLFSIGIFAQGLILLISKTFYAVQNTKIPALISIASVILNVILSVSFVWLLKFPNIFQQITQSFLKLGDLKNIEVIGLPLAISVSGIFQFILLLLFLYREIGDFRLKELWASLSKIILASIVMVAVVYLAMQAVSLKLNTQTFLGVFLEALFAGATGVIVYLLLTFFLGSPEIKIIKSSISEQFARKQ